MGTSFEVVYDAFLSKILEDEWGDWTIDEMELDLRMIMEAAIPWFKFPRTPLTRTDSGFDNELSNEIVQIIANYMVYEWAQRSILTWENIKANYTERDFSQANLLDKLNATADAAKKKAKNLEAMYYRSRNGQPYAYRNLASQTANFTSSLPVVTFKESDPTVSDWAKAEKKPAYTADEVGAIAQSDLQSATNTALAQAKASGEFDGAQGPKGDTGTQGPKGEQGDKGVDGYTPVKGTDYWTASDKAEMVNDVLAALPDGNEVSY